MFNLIMIGRLQHYSVGEYLRQRYEGFVTSDIREVYCLSSGAKRSLNGAYALLAGMYPPPSNKTIRKNLQWQPILVEFNPEHRDKFLQSTPKCLASEVEKRESLQHLKGRHLLKNTSTGAIAAVLQALKVFNNKIPSYTACIILKLYSQNRMYTVRLWCD